MVHPHLVALDVDGVLAREHRRQPLASLGALGPRRGVHLPAAAAHRVLLVLGDAHADLRDLVLLAAIVGFSRRILPRSAPHWLASIGLGLAVFLMWGAASFPWTAMRGDALQRVGDEVRLNGRQHVVRAVEFGGGEHVLELGPRSDL